MSTTLTNTQYSNGTTQTLQEVNRVTEMNQFTSYDTTLIKILSVRLPCRTKCAAHIT